MATAVRLSLWTILIHAVVTGLHGAAHQRLGITLSSLQILFVVIVINVAPLLAGLLLWKRVLRFGATLLGISMAGGLIFGVYNHFVAISPDHVSHVVNTTQESWVLIFQTTAVLLAVIEGFGVWVGTRILRKN